MSNDTSATYKVFSNGTQYASLTDRKVATIIPYGNGELFVDLSRPGEWKKEKANSISHAQDIARAWVE